MEEEQENANWGDLKLIPLAAPIEHATTTSAHGPDPSTSTSWGPLELLPQLVSTAPKEAPAAVDGEVASSREAP